MGKNKGPILRTLPPAQGGSTGHKGEVPIRLHAFDRGAVLEGHGLHLHGLRDFTAWIKQGSYYHGLVAQQGHLQRCPHLVGVPLPRWPQITPSESCRDLHKRAETLAMGSSEPSVRATAAPVQETPAEEHPVVEPPVMETPVAEAPAACSNTPAPMETGGAGDG